MQGAWIHFSASSFQEDLGSVLSVCTNSHQLRQRWAAKQWGGGDLLPTCFFFPSWVIYMSRIASTRGSFISERPRTSLLQRLPESNPCLFWLKLLYRLHQEAGMRLVLLSVR